MKRIHVVVDIAEAVQWSDDRLKTLLCYRGTGRALTGHEARRVLLDYLRQGKKFLPTGDDCEGFSYQTGCPGHEVAA